ncbi:MAG: type transport system permease protein [Acidimicrobiaceae bacterium]|jgi:ABC-2 type transport system permease protein|nr:type transport system permease protein [Acidimicrobiaceae bacterium]
MTDTVNAISADGAGGGPAGPAPEAPPMAPVVPSYVGAKRGRTAAQASREAFLGLMQRDLTVLKKNAGEFVGRTVIQPFLLVFVFLYVFPQIGQGIGSAGGTAGESAFASVLIAGVIGISIMFQGIMSVALPMATEFGYTKEIEDRVLAPMPVALVAVGKVAAGAVQGLIAAAIVFPVARFVHARGVTAHLAIHWPILVTLLPIACVMCAAFGLVLGTRVEPRNISAMFGFIVLPMTFLGGTYYTWTALQHVKVFGFPWLQTLVLVNPLIYVTEGFRAALTTTSHMHLYVIYPVLLAICAVLLWQGIAGFKKRVLA